MSLYISIAMVNERINASMEPPAISKEMLSMKFEATKHAPLTKAERTEAKPMIDGAL